MDILVGHTGFVGKNIAACHSFNLLCNSKNIAEAFGANPDLLVYAGVPAEMFLANKDPQADRAITENAALNIRRINPKRLVLISTIAVLDNPAEIDEDAKIDTNKLTAYGVNRLNLERLAGEFADKVHIIRLPALFGNGIKKNFIYDMINFFPTLLNKARYDDFSVKEPLIAKSYFLQENGLYKLTLNEENRLALKTAFERLDFCALNFTDSRAVFQFYNLAYLWRHIQTIIENDIALFHAATEPLSAETVYKYIYGKQFVNEIANQPPYYDFRTKHARLMGGINGYIFGKDHVLRELKKFAEDSIVWAG